MKEFVYTFIGHDYYLDSMQKGASFEGDGAVLLVIRPHDYEFKLSGEVLNRSSGKGYRIEITPHAAVRVFDEKGAFLSEIGEGEKSYREFQIQKAEEKIEVLFGHTETVDHYPNCDGEFDRYSTRWILERGVEFDPEKNLLSFSL